MGYLSSVFGINWSDRIGSFVSIPLFEVVCFNFTMKLYITFHTIFFLNIVINAIVLAYGVCCRLGVQNCHCCAMSNIVLYQIASTSRVECVPSRVASAQLTSGRLRNYATVETLPFLYRELRLISTQPSETLFTHAPILMVSFVSFLIWV